MNKTKKMKVVKKAELKKIKGGAAGVRVKCSACGATAIPGEAMVHKDGCPNKPSARR
jgi:hypothetical protein